uniref:Alkylated DNA repair protein AlkB homologue 8 N-terminal domain-containing protein n=1 Tax=Knipowitschia caucasica TaxID=637954 RepID=A0AAV2ITY2_KNICA
METPAQRPKTRSQTRDQVNCSNVPEGEYAEAAILESPVRVPVKFTTESFRDVEPLPLTIHTEEPVAPPVLSDVELPDLHSPAQNLDPENHLPEEPATSDPPTSLVGEEEVPEGEDYLEPVPVEEEILTNDLPVEPELSLDTEVADPSTVQPEPSFGPINSPETVSNVAEPETVLRRPVRQRQPPSRLTHDSVKLIKFADDTTLIGLISNNDESAYRREVDRLVSWCSGNNLELNAQKTVEMIVDFRKSTVPPPPPSVMDSPITSVESFRFLGTTITQDLKWEPTISSLIKKAQQRMYFLRQLRKAKLPAQMLVQFYTAIIESILTSSITVWFAGATVRDKQRLQRIVRSAEEVIGRSLPSLQDLQEAAVHQD